MGGKESEIWIMGSGGEGGKGGGEKLTPIRQTSFEYGSSPNCSSVTTPGLIPRKLFPDHFPPLPFDGVARGFLSTHSSMRTALLSASNSVLARWQAAPKTSELCAVGAFRSNCITLFACFLCSAIASLMNSSHRSMIVLYNAVDCHRPKERAICSLNISRDNSSVPARNFSSGRDQDFSEMLTRRCVTEGSIPFGMK